jgi:MarR family transcriptional regulator, organic hydroperoxide resistance regulator
MYRLTTSIPYLLNRLGVRMGELFSRRLQPYGLTLAMYRVLASLAEQPGQRLGDLADMTSIELSTMSRLISTMVGAGLVTRKRLPTDDRTVSIDLTSEGQRLAAILIAEAQHYEDVAVSQLSDADVRQLKSLLGEVYAATDILEAELSTSAPGRL